MRGRRPPKPETITAYEKYKKRIAELQKKYHVKPVIEYDLKTSFKKAVEGLHYTEDQLINKAFTGTAYKWNENQLKKVKAWLETNGIYYGDDEGARIVGGQIIREMNTSQKALGKYKFMYDPTKVFNWVSVEIFGSTPEYIKSEDSTK